MAKRRLGTASSVWSQLEDKGGLTATRVVTSSGKRKRNQNEIDEDATPELIIGQSNLPSSKQIEISNEQLKAIASTDTVSDVLGRISSYIAISSDASPNFAYIDLSDDYKSATAIQRDSLLCAIREHWQITLKLCFSKNASQMLGIQNLVQSWLTFGEIWACIIRDKPHGIPLQVVFTAIEPTKTTINTNESVWHVSDYSVWEQEDIIKLDYKELNLYFRSYVASIQRSFNIYSAVERTRIANAIMAAQFRSVYTVPTKGLGSKKARERLSTIMALYKRSWQIDSVTGEITVNGQNTWPVNQEIWVSETGSGSVRVENPGDGNPQLNDTDFVEYLMRRFYKQAKLPMSKYEAVDTSYLSGISELDEDERQFKLVINAHRAVLGSFFINITYRLMCGISEYAANKTLRENMTMHFYDEPEHQTPSEELDGIGDKLDRIEGLLDKLKTALESSGGGEKYVQARINWTRAKLMRKFVPELCADNVQDFRNVENSDDAMSDDDYSSATGEDSWMSSGSDDWGSSGSDDFSDFSDDDWEDEFDSGDTMGDDWSMLEDNSDFNW